MLTLFVGSILMSQRVLQQMNQAQFPYLQQLNHLNPFAMNPFMSPGQHLGFPVYTLSLSLLLS